jgi:hypothetical protein
MFIPRPPSHDLTRPSGVSTTRTEPVERSTNAVFPNFEFTSTTWIEVWLGRLGLPAREQDLERDHVAVREPERTKLGCRHDAAVHDHDVAAFGFGITGAWKRLPPPSGDLVARPRLDAVKKLLQRKAFLGYGECQAARAHVAPKGLAQSDLYRHRALLALPGAARQG